MLEFLLKHFFPQRNLRVLFAIALMDPRWHFHKTFFINAVISAKQARVFVPSWYGQAEDNF